VHQNLGENKGFFTGEQKMCFGAPVFLGDLGIGTTANIGGPKRGWAPHIKERRGMFAPIKRARF